MVFKLIGKMHSAHQGICIIVHKPLDVGNDIQQLLFDTAGREVFAGIQRTENGFQLHTQVIKLGKRVDLVFEHHRLTHRAIQFTGKITHLLQQTFVVLGLNHATFFQQLLAASITDSPGNRLPNLQILRHQFDQINGFGGCSG